MLLGERDVTVTVATDRLARRPPDAPPVPEDGPPELCGEEQRHSPISKVQVLIYATEPAGVPANRALLGYCGGQCHNKTKQFLRDCFQLKYFS